MIGGPSNDSARLNRVAVTLNGRAVTGEFQFDSGRQALVGYLVARTACGNFHEPFSASGFG